MLCKHTPTHTHRQQLCVSRVFWSHFLITLPWGQKPVTQTWIWARLTQNHPAERVPSFSCRKPPGKRTRFCWRSWTWPCWPTRAWGTSCWSTVWMWVQSWVSATCQHEQHLVLRQRYCLYAGPTVVCGCHTEVIKLTTLWQVSWEYFTVLCWSLVLHNNSRMSVFDKGVRKYRYTEISRYFSGLIFYTVSIFFIFN